jgi:hypothetical protein
VGFRKKKGFPEKAPQNSSFPFTLLSFKNKKMVKISV